MAAITVSELFEDKIEEISKEAIGEKRNGTQKGKKKENEVIHLGFRENF